MGGLGWGGLGWVGLGWVGLGRVGVGCLVATPNALPTRLKNIRKATAPAPNALPTKLEKNTRRARPRRGGAQPAKNLNFRNARNHSILNTGSISKRRFLRPGEGGTSGATGAPDFLRASRGGARPAENLNFRNARNHPILNTGSMSKRRFFRPGEGGHFGGDRCTAPRYGGRTGRHTGHATAGHKSGGHMPNGAILHRREFRQWNK